MLIISERYLRLVLGEYADHYKCTGSGALQQALPAGRPHPPSPGASVRMLRRDRLSGEYSQVT
jgi:hypothetical protein